MMIARITLPSTFGEMLKYLRRRAQLTQRELAIAVGYAEAHICRLEKNERMPDLTSVAALFVPALYLEDEPDLLETFLKLAARSRSDKQIASIKINQITLSHTVERVLGDLEEIPASYDYLVPRPEQVLRIQNILKQERWLALNGMAGSGKTSLAAAVARQFDLPVFWMSLAAGLNTQPEALTRQVALFFLSLGENQMRLIVERTPDSPPVSLDQQMMLIRAAASRRPALLCFDDAHLLLDSQVLPNQARPTQPGLDLLRHLVATTHIALLLTTRQDIPLPIPHLTLGGLETGQAQELISRLGASLSQPDLSRLIARTGGNPMLIRLAAGQIMAVQADKTAFIEHLETQPHVAAYMINTILVGLKPATEWLAYFLSVFRQPINLFDGALQQIVQEAYPLQNPHVEVMELRQRHLVDNPHQAALHPMVQNHIYTQLSTDLPRKKQFHRLAAKYFHGQDVVLEAAYHYSAAGKIQAMVDLISGQEDLLFQNGQAYAAADLLADSLQNIKTLRTTQRTQLERSLYAARGNLLLRSTHSSEAEADFRAALERSDSPQVRADLVAKMMDPLIARGAFQELVRLTAETLAALSPGDTLLQARLHIASAMARYNLLDYPGSQLSAESALEITRSFTHHPWRAVEEVNSRANYVLANCARIRREPQTALKHIQEAISSAHRGGIIRLENTLNGFMGGLLYDQGEMEASTHYRTNSMEGALALGDFYWAAYCMIHLSSNAHIQLEHQTALSHLDRARDLLQSIGDKNGLSDQDNMRATILILLGQVEPARQVVARLELQGDSNTRMFGYYMKKKAILQLICQPPENQAARSTLEQTLNLPGAQKDAMLRADLYTTLAMALLNSGDADEARQILDGSLIQEGMSRWVRLDRRLAEGWVALGQGNPQLAIQIAGAIQQDSGMYPLYQKSAEQLEQQAKTPLHNSPARGLWVIQH